MPELILRGGSLSKVGIWTGDIVEINDVRYRIDKINPKRYKMTRESDGAEGFGIDKSVSNIKLAEDQEWHGPAQKSEYEKYLETVEAGITLGTVVKLVTPKLASQYPGLYVVVALTNSGTRFRLAKLNGDGGRYLRNLELHDLERVVVG